MQIVAFKGRDQGKHDLSYVDAASVRYLQSPSSPTPGLSSVPTYKSHFGVCQ